MKITKSAKTTVVQKKGKSVKANTSVKATTDAKQSARKCILSAIQELGKVAASDEVAKESIANLGVIALDLSK